MNQNNQLTQNPYTLKNFLPLIIIFIVILAMTFVKSWWSADISWEWSEIMYDFMGCFLMVFGFFKIINLRKFVEAYQEYDIIAQRSKTYAYWYPFIEFFLGVCYFFRYRLVAVNIITIVLMIINSIGVFKALRQDKQIVCACLGALFKIPMTYVTLSEDLLMALMALVMLILHSRL